MKQFCGQECDYPPEHNCNGCEFYEAFSKKAQQQAISPKPGYSDIVSRFANNYGNLQHAIQVVEKAGGIVVFPNK